MKLPPILRSWQGVLIVVVVAVQLLLPLTYYLARRDKHDERFAWRMFSPMRMSHCSPRVLVDDKPFSLGSRFHEAWLELAERGRFSVIEPMAATLCAEHPSSTVRVTLDCTYLDRPPQTYGGYDMCNVPQL